MKILVVNAFAQTGAGQRRFDELLSLVKGCIDCDAIFVDTCTHRYEDISKYIFQQPTVSGLYPSVVNTVKELFEAEGVTGGVDPYQFRVMVTQLFQRLGVPLKPEFVLEMKHRVLQSFEKYDLDGSGDIDMDEVLSMLQTKPWCDMLPEPRELKQRQYECLKNFCELDMVIVDGDPNLVPWQPECRPLVQFVYQCWKSQQFKSSAVNVCMIGSAIVSQILQYLMINGPEMIHVFNGLKPGQGERNMRNLKTFDVSSTAIAQGSVMLDNSCGTCYTYSTAERKWQKQCEVGIVRNGSLPVPPRRFKKKQQNQLQDNSTTYVECLPQYYTHWLFKGLAKPSLFARCDRLWDLLNHVSVFNSNPRKKLGQINVMSDSNRGPEVLQLNDSQIIATMFPFMKLFPETATLLTNFIQTHLNDMKHSMDNKLAWFEWMQQQGAAEQLNLRWNEDQVEYKQGIRPMHADMKKTWQGRSIARSVSCVPPEVGSDGAHTVQSTFADGPSMMSNFDTMGSLGDPSMYRTSSSSLNLSQTVKSVEVRHLGVKATHNSLGEREHYDRNFKTKFHMGATRELRGCIDPYKTHKQCFRKLSRKQWLGGDMKYTGGSLIDQQDLCSTPTLPRYPVDDEINPLGNQVLGEILSTACYRRSHPNRWKGRCSRFPDIPTNFHRASPCRVGNDKNYRLGKMPQKNTQ